MKATIRVEEDRGHLSQVSCPRCRVTALYHPKDAKGLLVCVVCGFEDEIGGRLWRKEK